MTMHLRPSKLTRMQPEESEIQDKRSAVGSADHGVCAALHRVSAGQLDHLTYATELAMTVSPPTHVRPWRGEGREKCCSSSGGW